MHRDKTAPFSPLRRVRKFTISSTQPSSENCSRCIAVQPINNNKLANRQTSQQLTYNSYSETTATIEPNSQHKYGNRSPFAEKGACNSMVKWIKFCTTNQHFKLPVTVIIIIATVQWGTSKLVSGKLTQNHSQTLSLSLTNTYTHKDTQPVQQSIDRNSELWGGPWPWTGSKVRSSPYMIIQFNHLYKYISLQILVQ